MLRRRTERKAKSAATSLFKRVANGRDLSPNSPSVPVKRANQPPRQTKKPSPGQKVASKRADTLHSSKPLVKRDEEVSPKTLPSPKYLRPHRKCKNIHQNPASYGLEIAKASPTKSSPASKKGEGRPSKKLSGVKVCTSTRRQDAKMPQKFYSPTRKYAGRLPTNPIDSAKRTDFKTPEVLNDPAKECGVKLTQGVEIFVRMDSGKVETACGFVASKTDDSITSQKLTVTPKSREMQTLGTMPRRLHTVLPKDHIFTQLRAKYDDEINSEKNRDVLRMSSSSIGKNQLGETRDFAANSSPAFGKTRVEFDGGFLRSSPRKRRLEPVAVGEVRVKLTKLDGKSFAGDDIQTKPGSKSPRPAIPSICDSMKCSESAAAFRKNPGDSIVFPTGGIDDFLRSVGLVRKSEVKKSDVAPNKLHREAGGKLRRFLKPRLTHETVYRKPNIINVLPLNGISIDHVKNSFTGAANSANKGSPRPNATVPALSSLTSFTLLRLEKLPVEKKKSGPPILSRRLSADGYLSKQENGKPDSKVEASKEPSVAAEISDSGVVETENAEVVRPAVASKELQCITGNKTPTKRKYQPRKRTETESTVSMSAAQYDEPIARRSARQLGHRRKAWSHLLKANPDEYETFTSKWETHFENVTQNTIPEEDFSKFIKFPKSAASVDGATKSSATSGAVEFQKMSPRLRKHERTTEVCRLKNVSRSGRLGRKLFTRARGLSLPNGKRTKNAAKENPSKHLERAKDAASPCKQRKAIEKDDGDTAALISDESSVGCVVDFTCGNYARVLYRSKETDCIAPHMCSVCWVNDHMYCTNMKRTSDDLPASGGCIHNIPCFHYAQRGVTTTPGVRFGGRGHRCAVEPASKDGDGDPRCVERRWSDEDLMCRESMDDSDSESPSSVSPAGTEVLAARLHNRADQILRCLGVDRLPECNGRNTDSHSESDPEDVETDILPEEFGAEVYIENPDDDFLLQLGLDDRKDVLLKTSNSDPLCLENLEKNDQGDIETWSDVSPLDVFPERGADDRSLLRIPVCGNNSNVRVICVQVQKIDSDRVMITYPRKSSDVSRDPGDSRVVQKEVRFPSGADEKSLNEFLASEALRLVNGEPVDVGENPAPRRNPARLEPGGRVKFEPSPPFRLLGRVKRKPPGKMRVPSTLPLKNSPRRENVKRRRRRNVGRLVKSETNLSEKISNGDSRLEPDDLAGSELRFCRFPTAATDRTLMKQLGTLDSSSSCRNESVCESAMSDSCLQHSNEHASSAYDSATVKVFSPIVSSSMQDKQYVTLSNNVTLAPATGNVDNDPILSEFDRRQARSVDRKDVVPVESSVDHDVYESPIDRYLPLISEDGDLLSAADVDVPDHCLLQRIGASDDRPKYFVLDPVRSEASGVRDSQDSAVSFSPFSGTDLGDPVGAECPVLLTATDEGKMLCSGKLPVVTAEACTSGNLALAPVSGALSSASVPSNSAPPSFGRVIPVTFANCCRVAVGDAISLSAGGHRLPKPVAVTSSCRGVLPKIAPKTEAPTGSQSSPKSALSPPQSTAEIRVACQNGVMCVADAGRALK